MANSNIRITLLSRPNKRSGHELKPGQSTTVGGVLLVNQNTTSRWVDRYKPKRKK